MILAAEVFGDGQDAQHLSRIMPRAKVTMEALGYGAQGFKDTTWLADSNYLHRNSWRNQRFRGKIKILHS